jgi:hypothetical protein
MAQAQPTFPVPIIPIFIETSDGDYPEPAGGGPVGALPDRRDTLQMYLQHSGFARSTETNGCKFNFI